MQLVQWTDFAPYVPYLAPAAGAFGGAWIATFFAMRRFYREKVWERKAEAYTVIFGALYSMERWYDKNFDAAVEHRELPEEAKNELLVSYKSAEMDLSRRIASETWLIPEKCREILAKLTAVLDDDNPNWFEHL